MLLREHLEEYTKEQLLKQARSFELRKCSGLRKAALIERIFECFCAEDMLRSRLVCLTKEQMILFRKACDEPQDISINEIVDSMQLHMYWLGAFEELSDRFCVFEEVSAVFKRIDDEAFKTEQRKKGWMMKCVHFFINCYGIAPVEVIYELYRLKVKDTIDEMIAILWEMPLDIVESCIFPMRSLGLQDWPKDDPIYSSKGLLIHIPILENDEAGDLLDSQMDKEFYIPSVQQIEEICRIGYEENSLAYKKLQKFFMSELDLSYEQAVTWCLQVWVNSCEGELPAEVISEMSDADVVFKSEKQMNELLGLLMDAHNNTRMKQNRGHTPNELTRRKSVCRMPAVVPGSSHAAAMLRDAAPQLNELGIPADLEGSAEKKIYPNAPCPCGSGKKYKKCCGRK
ncbi:MAG TPA: SEC-C domain-containing protein [Candidatus Acetatifactor stercoripullorum]|uniref:SEC-C domain-containing protein n=1 Tax=Candidatus Acetatifactor stercoripullorum TaxID=2838414 RepID=A0A9D1R4H3_9FIRM|nr:SEC-C metal-binding domain-containing protein [uncultured Acetatifactor sp.]HIW80815.1 SEC-C domain-containing protein [Candidatus Acetatifactor stercoripullorum]